MKKQTKIVSRIIVLLIACMALNAAAKDVPVQLSKPDGKAPDMTKPIKVFILAGQSNMLEMGAIAGRGGALQDGFFLNANLTEGENNRRFNVAVYKGAYSPSANYDTMEPAAKAEAEVGTQRKKRVKRRRYPIPFDKLPELCNQDDHTTVFSGFVSFKREGKYEFQPGGGEGTFNVTTVDGKEVYRKNVGEEKPTLNIVKLKAGKRYAVKTVFFKKPDQNFHVFQTDLPGALSTLADENKKYAFLKDEKGEWVKRNDVVFLDVHPLVAKGHKGNFLQVPIKGTGKNMIGLELMFGHVMGTYYDEPVLLIRSACGNRGLWSGFRPPSRGGWEKKDDKYTWTGTEYRFMRDGVKNALKNIADIYPGYKGKGYDLAGFVWFQGHKDHGNADVAKEYEDNLVAFIKDVRKEFDSPKLPFMIATIGFDGENMNANGLIVHQAQMAVGDAKKHPEFAGSVKTADTRGFWRSRELSPGGAGYHYNNNAETYSLVGEALARGMVELLEKK